MIRIFIHGLVSGEPSEFDRQWLMFYDPKGVMFDAKGNLLPMILRTTTFHLLALAFPSLRSAMAYAHRDDGIMLDGKPHKPLAVFTLTFTHEIDPSKI